MGRNEQGVQASKGRWHVVPRTLCFVTYEDDVLLLKRAANRRIWPGKYNGVGGHVERGEDILHAARREIREETGLEVDALRLRGIVNIDAGEPDTGIALFVFSARATQREVSDTEEGELEWHPRNDLPQADLVDDLAFILPRTLDMKDEVAPFFARYWYNDQDRLQIDIARQ